MRRLLAGIPATKLGLLDRALVLAVALPRPGPARGRGGKRARRELPRPDLRGGSGWTGTWGITWRQRRPGSRCGRPEAAERSARGLGITDGTFYGNLRRDFAAAGLPPAGAHGLRHAAGQPRGGGGRGGG